MSSFTSSYVDLPGFRTMLAQVRVQTMAKYTTTPDELNKKADGSPLAAIDLMNHEVLARTLPKLRDVPVFSEENYPEFSARKKVDEYWLVDPLDGTKEFLSGVPEFTTLIALIEGSRPVFSCILAPSTGTIYWAEEGEGAFHETDGQLAAFDLTTGPGGKSRGLISRNHPEAEVQAAYEALGMTTFVHKGSALKFAALVENEADIYFRKRGPHEWDIAAGDLLVREAGGDLLCLATGGSLYYNQEQTRVAAFVATAPGTYLSPAEFQMFKKSAE